MKSAPRLVTDAHRARRGRSLKVLCNERVPIARKSRDGSKYPVRPSALYKKSFSRRQRANAGLESCSRHLSVARMPDPELDGEVKRVTSIVLAGIKRLPIKFMPRRAAAA